MSENTFARCIFINCPFDKDYEGILQAILFCLVYLGFVPRVATERIDGGENRLEKICELIESSQYSIHDLSRLKAKEKGEYYRLNMPFELGIDFGCRRYLGDKWQHKKILVLEETRHQSKIAISDLAGCDIEPHNGDYEKAVRSVRNWIASLSSDQIDPATGILDKYADFLGWHFEELLDAGFSQEDIQDYSTTELLSAMKRWCTQNGGN